MIEEFKLVGRKLFEEAMISSHAGNLSVRREDKIYITATGSMLSELKDEDIVEVPLNEESNAADRASMELVVHKAIYKNTKALAIVHAHPTEAIALSILEDKILPQDAEGRFYMKAVPVVRVKDPIASEEAGRMLPSIFNSGYNICMIKGHGSFAVGNNLLEAYKFTSVLSSSSRILVVLKSCQPAPRKEEHPFHGQAHKKPAIPHGIGIMGRRVDYHKR